MLAVKCRDIYEKAKKKHKYTFEEKRILRIVVKEIKRRAKNGECEYHMPVMMFPTSRKMIYDYLRKEGFTVGNDGDVLW